MQQDAERKRLHVSNGIIHFKFPKILLISMDLRKDCSTAIVPWFLSSSLVLWNNRSAMIFPFRPITFMVFLETLTSITSLLFSTIFSEMLVQWTTKCNSFTYQKYLGVKTHFILEPMKKFTNYLPLLPTWKILSCV